MPAAPRPQSLAAFVAALGMGLICGCETQDAGFHGYSEPAPVEPPVTADTRPKTTENGIVPASAETTRPLPEVAVLSPQLTAPTTAESVAKITGTESIGSAIPADPIVPVQPSVEAQPASQELALSIPPAPPVAANLASLNANPETAQLPARQMELLIPEKTFKAEGPHGALRVSFDDVDLLKVLNADPVPVDVEQHLPAWLSGLNGKTVRIRGWMFPPPIAKELPAFMFVRDNEICCFGRKPLIYDKFGVRMRSGVTTDYISGRPFDVEGRMVVKSRIQGGELFWLYLIEDAVVID